MNATPDTLPPDASDPVALARYWQQRCERAEQALARAQAAPPPRHWCESVSRQLYQALIDGSLDMIYAFDLQGRALIANQRMLQALGKSPEAVLGQRREQFMPLRDAILHEMADQQVITSGRALSSQESAHLAPGAGLRSFRSHKFPLLDEHGRVYAVGGVSTDITAELELDQTRRMSEAVFVHSSAAILITDAHNRIQRVNPGFCAQTGFSEAAVVGHHPSILRSGRHPPAFYEALWRELLSTGRWAGELTNRAANGALYTVWTSINMVRDDAGECLGFVSVQTDLTELRIAQSKAQRLASYDSLTGLPNRSLYTDRIGQLIAQAARRSQEFALLYMDLDHFKEVNDSLGHPVGDALLKAIAERLQSYTRAEDTVARMGGDEFVVLLPGADRAAAEQYANRLLTGLRQSLSLPGMSDYLPGASVGVALYPQHGDTADLLLRNADLAMYAAKLAGRNQYCVYDLPMSAENARQFALQTEVTAALRAGHLDVHFQARIDMLSGTMVGAEVLARWQPEGREPVPALEFIAAANRAGVLTELDRWVLGAGLRQLRRWSEQGLWRDAWRLSINRNVADLHRGSLLSEVQAALQAADVPPQWLEIEFTETALLEPNAELLEQLRALRALGVSLSIDDFGTGYSSLAYLKDLPVSTIKIDQSFVRDLLADDNDRVLVEAMVSLGQKLGHEVVAEGVETEEQRLHLLRIGCQLAQGHLYAQALDADAFAARFLHARADG